jgi:hypothetical protein
MLRAIYDSTGNMFSSQALSGSGNTCLVFAESNLFLDYRIDDAVGIF